MADKEYELVADSLPLVTSKPGDPLRYETRVKGDKVKFNEERARELIEAGAVKDTSSRKRGEKVGGETKAPTGKAEGVGDGDADEGAVGDGGPDPQGTGSTATGDGGGAGDGQGSAAGNPGASNPKPPSAGKPAKPGA